MPANLENSAVAIQLLLLLLLLSRFSRVRLCATPETAAPRLPRPRDSPGKNTGVGRHSPLQCMKVKSESEVAQSCPTPSDSMDCSPPGSSVHGIFQARVLEWGAIAFSCQRLSDPRETCSPLPVERWGCSNEPTEGNLHGPQVWRLKEQV